LTILHFRKSAAPLLDLSILKTKTFSITVYGGALFRIAINAAPYLLPLMFQIAFKLSAVASGVLVLWVFAGNFCMKFVTTPILKRFGFKNVLIVNGLIVGLSLIACGLLMPSTPRLVIIATLFVSGLSRSMQFTSLGTIGFADIPMSKMSAASSLFSLSQQYNNAMGVAIGALALKVAALINHHRHATLALSDFKIAFLLVGLLCVFTICDCFTLPKNAAELVSRHRE